MFDIATTSLIIISQALLLFFVLWKAKSYVDGTIDSVADLFEEAVTNPVVKASMSNLGKRSGEVRGQNAMVNKMATDVLNSPKLMAAKMGAKAIGLDLDEYVEENGAMETLQGLQSIADILGIDISKILTGGFGGSSQSAGTGQNPYI